MLGIRYLFSPMYVCHYDLIVCLYAFAAMDKYPTKVSMMITMSAWWLGTCIISVAYSANLVAIMSVEVKSYPVNSLEELATQTHIKVGAKSGTALHTTLQVS